MGSDIKKISPAPRRASNRNGGSSGSGQDGGNRKDRKDGANRNVGAALRSVYQETINEDIPAEMLDLLGKLG